MSDCGGMTCVSAGGVCRVGIGSCGVARADICNPT
jgi:hypothetical protein